MSKAVIIPDELTALALDAPPEGVDMAAHLDELRKRVASKLSLQVSLDQPWQLWGPQPAAYDLGAFTGAVDVNWEGASTAIYDGPTDVLGSVVSAFQKMQADLRIDRQIEKELAQKLLGPSPLLPNYANSMYSTSASAPVVTFEDGVKYERARILLLLEEASDSFPGLVDWVKDNLG